MLFIYVQTPKEREYIINFFSPKSPRNMKSDREKPTSLCLKPPCSNFRSAWAWVFQAKMPKKFSIRRARSSSRTGADRSRPNGFENR